MNSLRAYIRLLPPRKKRILETCADLAARYERENEGMNMPDAARKALRDMGVEKAPEERLEWAVQIICSTLQERSVSARMKRKRKGLPHPPRRTRQQNIFSEKNRP